MSEEERTKMFEDMQKQREELSRKTDEVLNALLEPAQNSPVSTRSLCRCVSTAVSPRR
jgi:erythromycin esterase-like protein